MGDRLRVLGLAIASITMIVAGALVMDWFVVSVAELDVTRLTFALHKVRACNAAGTCTVVPMSVTKASFYPEVAMVAFWGSLLFAVVVVYQAGSRLLSGYANEALTRAGYALASITIVSAVAAGYLASPDLDNAVIDVSRSWAPAILLAGLLVGIVGLYFTKDSIVDDLAYKPIENLPVAHMRTKAAERRAATAPPLQRERPATVPPLVVRPPTVPPVARTKPPSAPPLVQRAKKPSSPIPPPPEKLRGKIQFAIVSCEVSSAGIDARREDGNAVLVMWRDVVGLVARKLPAALDGAPFIDIVSTAGMTLRLLPWTRISGEGVVGEGDDRARVVLKLVAERCQQGQIDRATRAFLDGEQPPAQLSAELLAKHDRALA